METFIPATSPLFSLSPCRACTTGWTAELLSVNASESRYAWTSKHPSSVELNFTGTGISFSLFYPSSSSSWASSIFINGSAISNSTQANDLPWGLHHARLDLEPSTSNELNDWVRFEGAKISLGSLVGAKTKNGTIDDSVWRDGNVSLSSGWNMMEKGQSNWLNQTQMEIEGSHALNYWNESLSWTEQEGANTSITFTGAAVWVYGVVGSEAGRYQVILDNSTVGTFDAFSPHRAYGALLYTMSGLKDAAHTLTLINLDGGRRLSFDRLDYITGLLTAASPVIVAPVPEPTPSASGLPATKAGISGGALAGIVVGAVILVLGLALWALLAWTSLLFCLGRDKKPDEAVVPPTRPTVNSFWRWSSSTGYSAPPRPNRPSHVPSADAQRPFVVLDEKTPVPAINTATSQLVSFPGPNHPSYSRSAFPVPRVETGTTSFLRLSKSPKKATGPFSWTSNVPSLPSAYSTSSTTTPKGDADLPERMRKTTALNAAISDTSSPLTSLRDSFIPRVGAHKLGKQNRSISVKTARDDEPGRPPTPGGILDGYLTAGSDRTFGRGMSENAHGTRSGGTDNRQGSPEWNDDESKFPSMGERGSRRFFRNVLGEGRPISRESGKTTGSVGSGWRYM